MSRDRPGRRSIRRPVDEAQKNLLDDYVKAFTSYDIDALVQLLRKMRPPPCRRSPCGWTGGTTSPRGISDPVTDAANSRLVPLAVNGSPAFAAYKRAADGTHLPFSVQVLDLDGDRINPDHLLPGHLIVRALRPAPKL